MYIVCLAAGTQLSSWGCSWDLLEPQILRRPQGSALPQRPTTPTVSDPGLSHFAVKQDSNIYHYTHRLNQALTMRSYTHRWVFHGSTGGGGGLLGPVLMNLFNFISRTLLTELYRFFKTVCHKNSSWFLDIRHAMQESPPMVFPAGVPSWCSSRYMVVHVIHLTLYCISLLVSWWVPK